LVRQFASVFSEQSRQQFKARFGLIGNSWININTQVPLSSLSNEFVEITPTRILLSAWMHRQKTKRVRVVTDLVCLASIGTAIGIYYCKYQIGVLLGGLIN
jgi:hypothetical protein